MKLPAPLSQTNPGAAARAVRAAVPVEVGAVTAVDNMAEQVELQLIRAVLMAKVLTQLKVAKARTAIGILAPIILLQVAAVALVSTAVMAAMLMMTMAAAVADMALQSYLGTGAQVAKVV